MQNILHYYCNYITITNIPFNILINIVMKKTASIKKIISELLFKLLEGNLNLPKVFHVISLNLFKR